MQIFVADSPNSVRMFVTSTDFAQHMQRFAELQAVVWVVECCVILFCGVVREREKREDTVLAPAIYLFVFTPRFDANLFKIL